MKYDATMSIIRAKFDCPELVGYQYLLSDIEAILSSYAEMDAYWESQVSK